MTFVYIFAIGIGCFFGFFEKELTCGFGYRGRWFNIK
jgi:hypothetical protein